MGRLVFLATGLFLSASLMAEPEGFQDPALLKKVLAGEVVIKDEISTKSEFLTTVKSYFAKIDREPFYDLATNHSRYPDLAEEVQKGETLKVNDAKTEYDYKLDILVEYGPFSQHVYPEGRHTIVRNSDATKESKFLNTVTNYKDEIKTAEETIRLIPYQGGMLVEDRIHVVLASETDSPYVGIIKGKLKEFFTKLTKSIRTVLKADPRFQ